MANRFADYELDEGIYEDTGCALHPACLTCPLPACIEDTSYHRQQAERNAAILRDYGRGMAPVQLAAAYGLSLRRIQGITQPARPPGAQKGDELPVRAAHRSAMGGKKTAEPAYPRIF